MFVNLMRSNQRWLMIVISVLVIISFIWFYSDRTQVDRIVSDKVGTLYGRTLTATERDRVLRQIQTAASLGLYNIMDRDILGRNDETDVVVNCLVVEHQAEDMGIFPSDDEVFDAEQKLPAFQGPGGQFDKEKYTTFVSENLLPRGFSEKQLEDLVRRDLQFGKLRAIVDAPVTVSPLEARVAYDEGYAKTNASVVRFNSSDFTAGVAEPTEDEIKKHFDDNKMQYYQPEKRKVKYIKWLLTDDQKKLPLTEKNGALQVLGNQALALLSDLVDNQGKLDFDAAAAKMKLEVKETPDFEEAQTAGLEEANIPGFVRAAFRLSKSEPDSDVPLQTPDGFYDLHLSGVTPLRPQTLDEARAKVIKAIKDERVKAAMTAKAEEVRGKIAEALKAGKPFADAVQEAGQKAVEVPAFSRAEPARTAPDAATIAQTSSDLGVGELSKFVDTDNGGMLIYVRSREGVDPAKFDQQKDLFVARLLQQKSSFYFQEWLRTSRELAKVSLVPRHARG